jgi:hypothetical protein
MPTTRIAIEVEIELSADDARATFPPALRALVDGMLAAPDALASKGAVSGEAGAARWRVQSWAEGELVRCIGCQRMVPRSETDVTENGERCQRCGDQGQIDQHWLAVEETAFESGYYKGWRDGRYWVLPPKL